MSVQYRGIIPTEKYKLNDFYRNGVVISWGRRFRDVDNKPALRVIFRSNGYLGEIRTTCYGDTFAVDVRSEWGDNHCLTTECKNIQEAKSILFLWFKSKGFKRTKKETDNNWRYKYLEFNNVQLNLFPLRSL